MYMMYCIVLYYTAGIINQFNKIECSDQSHDLQYERLFIKIYES